MNNNLFFDTSGKMNIEKLTSEGKREFAAPVRAFSMYEKHVPNHCFAACFVVPKRNFKRAVDRNLLKRRMREAFRKCSKTLEEKCRTESSSMAFMFLLSGKEIASYKKIESCFGLILQSFTEGYES